jgi:4-(2-carboxyphenyl)-2-oxobut-3-enoate aldolase
MALMPAPAPEHHARASPDQPLHLMTASGRISPLEVRGIWPPMLLYWDSQWRLDERSTDANLDRQLAAGPHGLYTLDTASEFYTLEWAAWRAIAERFVRRCRSAAPNLPLGLGCTWTNQEGALDRLRLARDLGVQTVHLSPPYWVPLNEEGVLRFFAAVQAEAGPIGVVVYAPPHGRLTLNASLYLKLTREAPCIIGTKALGADGDLIHARQGEPRHSHFVHESFLTVRARDGALGNYSSLAGVSLSFMTRWWSLIERGDWTASQDIQDRVNRFYAQAVQPTRDRGILAGAIDKALAQIGGASGNRLMRPPYPAVPDDLFANLIVAAKQHLPEAFDR